MEENAKEGNDVWYFTDGNFFCLVLNLIAAYVDA
jgi:hypothetical protein